MSSYSKISLSHNVFILHVGSHQSIRRRPPAKSSGRCCSNGSGRLLQSTGSPRSRPRPPSTSSPPPGSAPQSRHLETSSGAHTHLTRSDPVLTVLTPPTPPLANHSQSGASPPKAHCEEEKIMTRIGSSTITSIIKPSRRGRKVGSITKEGATGVPTLFPSPLTASSISVRLVWVIYSLVDEWTNAGIVGIEQYCMYLTSLFLPSIYTHTVR